MIMCTYTTHRKCHLDLCVLCGGSRKKRTTMAFLSGFRLCVAFFIFVCITGQSDCAVLSSGKNGTYRTEPLIQSAPNTSSSSNHALKFVPETNNKNGVSERTLNWKPESTNQDLERDLSRNKLSHASESVHGLQNDTVSDSTSQTDRASDNKDTIAVELESVPVEGCDIFNELCSPFHGSPCNSLDRVPGLDRVGQKCNISESQAEKLWESCGNLSASGGNHSSCYCYQDRASCCGGLTSIPDLTAEGRNVRFLNFTSNNLTRLDREVLRNYTHLRWLILNGNNISDVTRDALQDMTSLEHFELAHNNISQTVDAANFTKAVNCLNETLRVLVVNYTQFFPLSLSKDNTSGITYIIRNIRLPYLTQLFVDGCGKRIFYLSDVKELHSLCKLSLKSNRLEKFFCCSKESFGDFLHEGESLAELEDFDTEGLPYNSPPTCVSPGSREDRRCQNFRLSNLKLLDLANNSQVHVPRFCNSNSTSGKFFEVLPNISHLSLSINAIVDPKRHQFKCLTHLTSLALTGNPLKHVEALLLMEMKNLHDVDLRFTNVMQADPLAFSHATLKELTIESSNWFVDQHHEACCISPAIFNGSNLEVADLSYNNFRFAKHTAVTELLYPLRTVRKLMMEGVGLQAIPSVILDHFTQLTFLGFQSNTMSEMPACAFQNMRNLEYLDLSDNDLANPDVEVIHHLVETQNVSINLESNPFSCTCDMLQFLNFYKAHRDMRPQGDHISTNGTGGFVGHHYQCFAPRSLYNTHLEDLQITIHTCLLTVVQEILIYFVCFFFIFCLLAYALLYKYRWQVRYWMYMLHERLARRNVEPFSRPGARFTAFVSYCKEDSNFVLTKALPALERNHQLALCIHERDFIPGTYISQNVVERMAESCHVLLVLSNNFLKNDWCRFELFVAQQYGQIHRRIPVTVLHLEPLRVELMDAHVIALLQSVPGVEWPGWGSECSARAVERFWSRLGRILGSRR